MEYGRQSIEPVNWLGVRTLLEKEVRRFLKVFSQTIVAPVVTTLVFFAIFSLALGRAVNLTGGVSFEQFLVPGLIILSILQNAFANTSSSIMIAKIDGSIVDVLMPPLSAAELSFCYIMGGIIRGILVGVAVALSLWLFAPVEIHNIWFVLFHGLAACSMLSVLGVIGGIWARKFDHLATITNFVITPFTLMSGTFYSIDRLSGIWVAFATYNPFFYLIDGFRYGFIGEAGSDLGIGILLMVVINAGLWWTCYRMFATGYRLRA